MNKGYSVEPLSSESKLHTEDLLDNIPLEDLFIFMNSNSNTGVTVIGEGPSIQEKKKKISILTENKMTNTS